jgi:NodT family efflux transporter outer membrane factor (OMF) lipoprotein
MRKYLAILVVMGLVGCAPDLGALTEPRADLTAGADKSDTNNYPPANWWEAYNDPQLNALITEGLKNSPSITEALARVRSANAAAQTQGASLEPTLDANGVLEKYRESYNQGVPSAFVPHGFNNDASASLNFNYELDFWGKNHDALAAAMSEAKAAELDAEQGKMIVATNIATTYATLATQYAELDAAKDSTAVHTKVAELVAQRFTIGLENQGAVEQEKAKAKGLESEVAALEESIALTKNSLAALMGATPDRADSITRPDINDIKPLGIPAVVPADLIARRPDLLAARERMTAAAHRINVAHAGYYPNINLMANIGHESLGLGPFFKNTSLTGAFGPAIDLPIFEGGTLEGNYRGARADYDVSVAQFEGAMVEALHQVADATTSMKALMGRADALQESLNAAQKAFDITNNRYKGGLGSYLDVLNAEDTLIVTRFAVADIEARGFTLDVALVKALGGGYMPPTKDSNAPTKETQS